MGDNPCLCRDDGTCTCWCHTRGDTWQPSRGEVFDAPEEEEEAQEA